MTLLGLAVLLAVLLIIRLCLDVPPNVKRAIDIVCIVIVVVIGILVVMGGLPLRTLRLEAD